MLICKQQKGPSMKHLLKGYLFIITSALIFGCMPLGAKFIYAEGVNSLSLVFLRNCLAIPVLAFLAKSQGQSLRITKDALIEISITAVMGCCITPVLLFASYNYLESGTATIFHFIYPAVVVIGGILFLREKLRKNVLLCVLICTVGICLFYNPGEPINLLGSVLALLSGITYAAYILLLSVSKHKEISGFKFSFYIALICSVLLLLVCLVSGQLTFPVTLRGWLLCIAFSLSLCVGAVVLFQQGTFLIGGQRAAILSTVEPITSIFMGVIVFQETVTIRTALGSFLVVLASILIAVFDMKSSKKASV